MKKRERVYRVEVVVVSKENQEEVRERMYKVVRELEEMYPIKLKVSEIEIKDVYRVKQERIEQETEDLDLYQLKQDILDCIEKNQYKIIRSNKVTIEIDPKNKIVVEKVIDDEELVTNIVKYVEDLTNYLKENEIE